MMRQTLIDGYAAARERLRGTGQEHLLKFWSDLSDPQRVELLSNLERIDLARCRPLIDRYVRQRPVFDPPQQIEPPNAFPAEPDAKLAGQYREAMQRGTAAIRAGRVAAFTVAGGQGSRLGYDGPKGGFPISPVRNASLFRLFAEGLLGTERRYGRRPRWYIMTSPSNHESTLASFEEHGYFGLRRDDIMFFSQGQMPAFLPDGRIALEEKHRIALSPDGHGGSLTALSASGALADMRERGIEQISYFQVDNPLVRAIDPLFVGLHLATESEMSSKAVTKADDLERVGNFCLADGKLGVIEYSDLPASLARARNADGSRRFDAGSIAIHVLDRGFVERVTTAGSSAELPWHRADKKVEMIDLATGQRIKPVGPNAVKLEMFVFDAIPLARNPLVLFTRREEEFSPVKNAEGADSPATTRRDMIRRAARWLEACGCTVPRRADGEPDALIEIAPSLALDAADLAERKNLPRSVARGETLLLI
ncbi:MAG: UTP--glucose-1-phosphate uridylyltransferase [Planctomycetes bacterium]|nr:UTP--glucose-1-phosphate uridylyltransferase [Planctomycetota bacterium]